MTTLWDGDAAWEDLPVYLLGPGVGGVPAAYAYDLVARPADAGVALSEPPQGTAWRRE